MIKVILWDIDGTLLNFLEAEKAAIRKCFEIFGLGICTDEMLSRYSKINKGYWEKLERNEMSKHDILVGRFHDFFQLYGLDISKAEAFNDEYQIRLGDTICFHEGAWEVLNALKGKCLQCAVTNGTKTAQVRKLKNSHMDTVFDHVFISEELGIEKPNKEFFDEVFRVIGLYEKEEVMIIGDSLTSDMRGGLNAGILTCWYAPGGQEKPEDMPLDFVIRSLNEIPGILETGR